MDWSDEMWENLRRQASQIEVLLRARSVQSWVNGKIVYGSDNAAWRAKLRLAIRAISGFDEALYSELETLRSESAQLASTRADLHMSLKTIATQQDEIDTLRETLAKLK